MKAFQWLGLILLLAGVVAPSSAAEAARVDVILWFDTEDYLSPADDDACKRLATMLTERHIRATFKVVGEKARVLERRGRRDAFVARRARRLPPPQGRSRRPIAIWPSKSVQPALLAQ